MDMDNDFMEGLGSVDKKHSQSSGVQDRKMMPDVEIPDIAKNQGFTSASSEHETDNNVIRHIPVPDLSDITDISNAQSGKSTGNSEMPSTPPPPPFSPMPLDQMPSRMDIDNIMKSVSKVSEKIDKLKESVEHIHLTDNNGNEMLQALKRAVDLNSMTTETLKRAVNANHENEERNYKELQAYKNNQYYNYIRPFMEFLLNILSDLRNTKMQYESNKADFTEKYSDELYNDIVVNLIDYYIDQIETQLEIQGVETVVYEECSVFISSEQMIGKPVFTDNQEFVGKVAVLESPCYKFEDKILKKARVRVYKMNPDCAKS